MTLIDRIEGNGVVARASITLSNFSHTHPDDVDILLTSPAGTNVLVLANNGGGNTITNVTLTLDNTASTPVPIGGQIVSGTNRPNPNLPVASFPAPAPNGPYATNLNAFAGSNPNPKEVRCDTTIESPLPASARS